MSVALESASRLSALKSKIDTATGVSSSTLSEAVENAIEKGNVQTEEKTVTPTASAQTVTPTSGKYLSKVTVNAVPTQTKTVTPTESDQTVTPDSGKFLSSVLVKAAAASGKTVYSGEKYVESASKFDIDTGVQLESDAVFVVFTKENYADISNSQAFFMIKSSPTLTEYYRTYSGGDLSYNYVTGDTFAVYNGTVVTVNYIANVSGVTYKWILIQ